MKEILPYWKEGILILLSVYELIVRIKPTIKDYTVISFLAKALYWLSNNLQLKKDKK